MLSQPQLLPCKKRLHHRHWSRILCCPARARERLPDRVLIEALIERGTSAIKSRRTRATNRRTHESTSTRNACLHQMHTTNDHGEYDMQLTVQAMTVDDCFYPRWLVITNARASRDLWHWEWITSLGTVQNVQGLQPPEKAVEVRPRGGIWKRDLLKLARLRGPAKRTSTTRQPYCITFTSRSFRLPPCSLMGITLGS
jgi:hypothetical protein